MRKESDGRVTRRRILVANEPRSYRETFARVFEALRPHVEAIAVDPDALDREALRLRPDLVVCGRVTPTVVAVARCWMELRVEGERLVTTSKPRMPSDGREVDLAYLLSFIDRSGEMSGRDRGDALL
ncbi:MAG TPA: hypothetical protein VF068_07380 [Rubrobacter sp.]